DAWLIGAALASVPTPTFSLHDALPISAVHLLRPRGLAERDHHRARAAPAGAAVQRTDHRGVLREHLARHRLLDAGVLGRAELGRSEEHTSELQSRFDLVCRLLLDKIKG